MTLTSRQIAFIERSNGVGHTWVATRTQTLYEGCNLACTEAIRQAYLCTGAVRHPSENSV